MSSRFTCPSLVTHAIDDLERDREDGVQLIARVKSEHRDALGRRGEVEVVPDRICTRAIALVETVRRFLERVEGYTNFLWTVILAGFSFLAGVGAAASSSSSLETDLPSFCIFSTAEVIEP